MSHSHPSGDQVLAAFAAKGVPVRLEGGEGQSWRVGDVVFKPAGEGEEANWVAEVLAEVIESGFRVQRPVRASNGAWIVSGWTAWHWVDGAHDLDARWSEVLDVGAAFLQALSGLSMPAFLDRRANPWSVGDRAAWGEALPEVINPAFAGILERLYAFLKPLSLASQVIHGDLTGNILFAPGQPPAVIDFSPYYRPAGFALAVVIVDAIAWYGATSDLAWRADHLQFLDQLLARAAIYRLVTADQVSTTHAPAWSAHQVRALLPIVDLVGA
jgi:uncharacterized protein (TIGR02569 family)